MTSLGENSIEEDEERGQSYWENTLRSPFLSSNLLQRQLTNKFVFNDKSKIANPVERSLIIPETVMSNYSEIYYSTTDSSFLSGDGEIDYDFVNNSTSDSPEVLVKLVRSFSHKFDGPEYAVFAAVLLLSAAIGVFYGCFGKGQKSTEEYLIADRQMSTIPAALSLLCSFISAITILGNPVEIYLYGSSFGLIVISFIPLTLSLAYLYVPVFHNLQLNSAYEYFELRFNRSVRTVISVVGIIHYIVYMSIVVYGPSLAIGQVTGISVRMSTAVIFVVCIFYSTLGGLKAVIITDALQALIMIGSLAAIVIKGILDIGGFEEVWEIASRYGRTEFFNLDLDPRVRHTVFTAIVGGYLQWLPNFAATHSQIQRYLCMSSLASIRRALLMNLIGFTVIFALCYLAGLAVFAKYHSCDPIQMGTVSHSDQLLPLFVLDTLGDYPGLPGLFVAGITCASLSSVSSGLNALSAIVTYDFLKNWMPLLTDATLLKLSKSFCILFGAISFGFIFVAENLGNILPAAFSIAGIVLGPTLGVFTLGMFFPWANSKGSLLGLLSAFFIMTSLVVGNQIAAYEKLLPDQTLPGLTTDGCVSPTTVINYEFNTSTNSSIFISDSLEDAEQQAQFSIGSYKKLNGESEFLLDIFSISYMWYPGLGCTLCIFFGLIFSLILTKCEKAKGVNPNHLSPPILWLLCRLFPIHSAKWIDVEDYPVISSGSSTTATLSLRSTDFTFRKESVCDMKLKRLSIFDKATSNNNTGSLRF